MNHKNKYKRIVKSGCSNLTHFISLNRMRTEQLIKVTQEEAEKLRKEEVLGW